MMTQNDISPALQARIDRLLNHADSLFALGNIRERCQAAIKVFHEDKQPSPFATWGVMLRDNREYRFALSLVLTYTSTRDEIIQLVKGCLEEYLLQEVKEERERQIEFFARMKIASRWYQMKDDDQAWRVFAQNIPYGEKDREEEIRLFFETLDRICILTDILTGHAAEYGLNVEYIENKYGAWEEAKQHENIILKKNHNGKPIDFQALHKRIETAFVAEIKYGYEWLSLWRMLYDLNLLEDTALTACADQMNKWYPNAKKPCCADSMGDYFNPYLGTTAFALWDEEEFKKHKTSKQSITGYRRLYNDCETIKEALKSLFR